MRATETIASSLNVFEVCARCDETSTLSNDLHWPYQGLSETDLETSVVATTARSYLAAVSDYYESALLIGMMKLQFPPCKIDNGLHLVIKVNEHVKGAI